MSNIKTIYARWVAIELRKLGFQIIAVRPNPTKIQYDCYDFRDSPELEAAFSEILARNEKN